MITPTTVSDLISHIESSGNAYAYRFEPTVYKNLSTGALTPEHLEIVQNIMSIHRCSQSSAMVIYSSSYGLYQIMGFNLYGQLNCNVSIFKFCNDPISQTVLFGDLLTHMNLFGFTVDDLAKEPDSRLSFAMHYNGSAVYADAIIAALQYFKIPVTV